MTRNFKPAAVLVIALMGATISTAAVAERGPMGGMMGMPSFEELDADKDGQITKEELAARHAARFTQADADKDGKLSAEELIAMREAADAALWIAPRFAGTSGNSLFQKLSRIQILPLK